MYFSFLLSSNICSQQAAANKKLKATTCNYLECVHLVIALTLTLLIFLGNLQLRRVHQSMELFLPSEYIWPRKQFLLVGMMLAHGNNAIPT